MAARKPTHGGLGAGEVAAILRTRRPGSGPLAAALLPWRRQRGPWSCRLLGAVLAHVRLHPLPDGRALDYVHARGRDAVNVWRVVRGVDAPRPPRKPRGKPPRLFKAFGGRFTLAQLMERSVVPWHRLYERIVVRGWTPERACREPARTTTTPLVTFPKGALNGLIAPGETLGIPELAARTGQREDRLRKREAVGLSPLEIVAPARRARDRHVDDLTHRRFGLLVVLGLSPRRWGKGTQHRLWFCQCDCGAPPKEILGFSLLRKKKPTRSCGCLRAEANAARGTERAKRYEVFGELLTLAELSVLAEVPTATLRKRLAADVSAAVAAFGHTIIQEVTPMNTPSSIAAPPAPLADRPRSSRRPIAPMHRVRFPPPLLARVDGVAREVGTLAKRAVSRAAVVRALVHLGLDAVAVAQLAAAAGVDPVRRGRDGGRSTLIRVRFASPILDRLSTLTPKVRLQHRPIHRDSLIRALVQITIDTTPASKVAQTITADPVRRGRLPSTLQEGTSPA